MVLLDRTSPASFRGQRMFLAVPYRCRISSPLARAAPAWRSFCDSPAGNAGAPFPALPTSSLLGVCSPPEARHGKLSTNILRVGRASVAQR